ncbi:ABC transporter substrate-binding protein, partial [Patescibacteria group bacterium]
DVVKVNLTAKEAAEAFMNGEVDIAVSYEPYVYEAISQGDAEVIFDTKNERGLIPDVLVVEEGKLEERREDFEKVVKAWFRAVDYLKNNHIEATTLIGERMGLTQEEYAAQLSSLYILDLRDNITAFSVGSGFDSLYGSGRLISDFFLSKNLIEESPDITEMLDNSIVKDLYNTSSN